MKWQPEKEYTDLAYCKHKYLLKVSKFQNEFTKLSFLPKYEQNIVRVYALHAVSYYTQDLLTFIDLFLSLFD